jgi:uncharacterized DUF497 family protein
VNIIWDEDKNDKLNADRGISLDEIATLILQKQYIDIVKHPKPSGQWMFIVPINAYIHVVPFVLDSNGNIVLKTAFPSRKFHKRFGASQT